MIVILAPMGRCVQAADRWVMIQVRTCHYAVRSRRTGKIRQLHNMKLEVQTFCDIPTPCLLCMAPCSELSESVCMLTLVNVNELSHAVRGSDGHIYDARMLQTWLRCQSTYCKFVIPNCPIKYVHTFHWTSYTTKYIMRIWNVYLYNFVCTIVCLLQRYTNPTHSRPVDYNKESVHAKANEINVCHKNSRSDKNRRVRKRHVICIPSDCSAFTKFER